MRRDLPSIVAMAGMLVVSQAIALLLAPIFLDLNFQAFPDASNPVNPILYIVLILAFTAVILLLVRYRKRNLAKYVILGSIFFTIAFVFVVPLYLATYWWMDPELAGNVATIGAFLLAILIVYALHKYPEWYLVDTVGIAIAAGVTAVLGISFAILPAFLLLAGLAVYDAWAVYRSKHMVTLADEMTSQRLPILLVIPKKAGYSFREQKSLKAQVEAGEDREAMFMGLGDLIIPGILSVSAFTFPPLGLDPVSGQLVRDVPIIFGLPSYLFIAICTIIGSLVGYAILMRFVMKGNPQAGLPLLNGGAIAGYLLSFFVVYGGNHLFGLA
jgi:presenilin-like A22 family membrane protease